MTREALAIERVALTLGELVRINFGIRFYVLVLPRGRFDRDPLRHYMKVGYAYDAMAVMVYERLRRTVLHLPAPQRLAEHRPKSRRCARIALSD